MTPPVATAKAHGTVPLAARAIQARPVTKEGSLLPPPADVVCDPMEMLHALTIKQRETDLQGRTNSIEHTKKSRAEAFKAYEKALAEAKRAREKKSFFGDLCSALGKIGTALAAVAAVASIIATGGASLPAVLALASVAMSTLATVNQEFGIIGGEFGKALNTGLAIGSAACGLGAAGAGLLNLGVSASTAAGNGASAAAKGAKVATYVGKGAQLGASAAQGASAAAGGITADYKHDEEHSLADGEAATAQMRKIDRQQRAAIAETRAIVESYQRSVEILLSAMGDAQRTQRTMVTSSAIRG